MTTPEAEGPDLSQTPISVVQAEVAAYQWDEWRDVALVAHRSARKWSMLVGSVVAAAVGLGGVILLPGSTKFAVVVYGPVVAWPVAAFVRSRVLRRKLARVLDRVRPVLLPALVPRLADATLLNVLIGGRGLDSQTSTTIVTERQDAVVVITASEFDLSYSENWNVGSTDTGGMAG